MTAYELIKYQMTRDEMQVWEALVEDGDKGIVRITFKSESKEEAVRAIFSDMAHDFRYRYVADNMREINNIKKKEWDYDTEYDYRK